LHTAPGAKVEAIVDSGLGLGRTRQRKSLLTES
jgi:hypothetical protein